MNVCIMCHFEAELDDVVLAHVTGRCICLRCYSREVGTARPVSRHMRREVASIFAALEVA